MGIDGTTWSVINTPANNARVPRAKTRRGLAAFGKAGLVALVELGTHGPLAAHLGLDGQGELASPRKCWSAFPRRAW